MNLAHLTHYGRSSQPPTLWQRVLCNLLGHRAPYVEWRLGIFALRRCLRCDRLIWTKGAWMVAYHHDFFDGPEP